MEDKLNVWESRAREAQHALDEYFWNDEIHMYNIQTPCPNGECNTVFHYWWMAHAVDNLVDAYQRTKETKFIDRLAQIYDGLLKRNGGAWPNEFYDDMEWMAIAWLRAYHATGEECYRQAAITLWKDIQTGWSDNMGGGIAWRKSQLDYKNTPANAPAAILAARMHQAFGSEEDLAWAVKIYDWQSRNLVDPGTGFVWDGMNRMGNGEIDKHWKFTYCQGVYIGACLELYRISQKQNYLQSAVQTARAAIAELAAPGTTLLPPEGKGDGGLFKGIFVRYLTALIIELKRSGQETECRNFTELLTRNANSLWDQGRKERIPLFGNHWDRPAEGKIDLSTQLSGVMLMEMLAAIE